MKFLHTADLHLGRRINDIPLLEDQKYLLEQIIAIAESENVEGVLIAGDIYDKSMPGGDAMKAFDAFIGDLVKRNIKVFMISGNHDSADRISYFSQLIKSNGIFTCDTFNGLLQTIKLNDEFGVINVHLLPFIRPIQARRFYLDDTVITYEDAVHIVLENSNINESERNILLCHQFITGAETSDSEELAIGGLDCIRCSVFDVFDYVALGHLHKPQKVLRETVRYAGSPMKYSLSETDHKKSVTIIEIADKNTKIGIKQIPLNAAHDVREVRGTFAEIMAMDYSEDYVRVVVTDEMVSPDARVSVSTVFPNMITFAVINKRTAQEEDFVVSERIENKSKIELFCDFYRLQNNNVEPERSQLKILEDILREMEEDNNETN